jgi:hypothetical protein
VDVGRPGAVGPDVTAVVDFDQSRYPAEFAKSVDNIVAVRAAMAYFRPGACERVTFG